MAQMMAQMANPQGEQGASAGAPPPPPPPVSTAAPLPPGPPPAAAASAPPPAAVLSVAERIAAKIAAKAATEGSCAGGGDSASSSSSSSFGGSGAGSSSSAVDGGRKRKFTEGEARERPSARCAVDRSEDFEVHALALREARDDLQAPVEQPRVIQRIGNMLPEEELAKYTTLLPGNDKKRKEEEEDKGEVGSVLSQSLVPSHPFRPTPSQNHRARTRTCECMPSTQARLMLLADADHCDRFCQRWA
jgi:hypothetical protein